MPFNPAITDEEMAAIYNWNGAVSDFSTYLDLADKVLSSLPTIPSELRNEIGKYLAGHFALLYLRQGIKDRVMDTEATYATLPTAGYMATTLGEQACTLDYTGTLRRLSKPRSSITISS